VIEFPPGITAPLKSKYDNNLRFLPFGSVKTTCPSLPWSGSDSTSASRIPALQAAIKLGGPVVPVSSMPQTKRPRGNREPLRVDGCINHLSFDKVEYSQIVQRLGLHNQTNPRRGLRSLVADQTFLRACSCPGPWRSSTVLWLVPPNARGPPHSSAASDVD